MRKNNKKGGNLGVDAADLVGEEGEDAGPRGEALQPPQLLQVQPQLVRRHLRSALLSLSLELARGFWWGGQVWLLWVCGGLGWSGRMEKVPE